MYKVIYVVDEHDRLYGGTERTFTDKDRALQFASNVDALGVYDEEGRPVVNKPVDRKPTSKEKS